MRLYINNAVRILILIILLPSLFTCSSDDSENIVVSSLEASFDGILREFKNLSLTPDPNPNDEPLTGIFGATLEQPTWSLKFIFPIENGEGTYELSSEDHHAFVALSHGWLDPDNRSYAATNGSIIVTEITSNSYKGTFSFTAQEIDFDDSITVTNGSFEIFY